MTPEQISPRVAIFAIACCLGVTLFSTSNARAQDRSAKEVHPQTVDATIIEFATPAPAPTDNAAPCWWAVIWARDKALSLICGPDREHVVDFYQTHSEPGAKK
jgi:hypothetical protein